MNKICLLCIVALFQFTNCLKASEQENYMNDNQHRLSLSLNALAISLDSEFADVIIKGTDAYIGPQISYEYLLPESFYFAGALSITCADKGYPAYYKNTIKVPYEPDLVFSTISFDVGYTKKYGNLLFTPYAGIGNWHLHSDDSNKGLNQSVSYNAYGIRLDYFTCACSSVGINLKVFRSFHTTKKFETEDYRVEYWWETPGATLSLPGRTFFGNCNQWDLQVEPYFMALSFGEKQIAYGANIGIGYHF